MRLTALETIKAELHERMAYFEDENKLLARERIQQRTMYDLEMIKEVGFCKGIENYSRHFSASTAGRAASLPDRLLPRGLSVDYR